MDVIAQAGGEISSSSGRGEVTTTYASAATHAPRHSAMTYPTHWSQLCTLPAMVEITSGPNARAGLMAPPVTGPSVTMMAATASPMIRPAQPLGATFEPRPSTMNISTPVPNPSASSADVQLVTA